MASRERASSGLMGIGQVLTRLSADFPKLSSSKLRYLEEQGIVTPSRTASGYRKFSPENVERLRLALILQRDHYLPLNVIRDYLDDRDAGRSPAMPTPPTIHAAGRRYSRTDLLAAAGSAPQLLNDAISTGIIAAGESYPESALSMLRALVALDRHGIEPRHVRVLKQSAERELALIESALSSLLRRADAPSRAKADEVAPQLAAQLDEVRQLFIERGVERMLGR